MDNQQTPLNNQYDDEIDLSVLLDNLLEAKWLIIAITVFSIIAGVFYALISTPIYQADTVLQVEERTGAASGLWDDTKASTEIEIIKSRDIVGKAIDQLDLRLTTAPVYFPVIGKALARMSQQGKRFQFFDDSTYAQGGAQIQIDRLTIPDHFEGEVFFLKTGDNGNYELFDKNQQSILIGKANKLSKNKGFELFISVLQAKKGVRFSLAKNNRLATIKDLQGRLSVSEKGKNTGILQIKLAGENPEIIQKTIDSIANLYLRKNVDRVSQEAQNSLSFLQLQLPKVKEELNIAKTKLNDYRASGNYVDLTIKTQSLLSQVVILEQKLSQLTIKKKEYSRQYTVKHPLILSLSEQEKTIKNKLNNINKKILILPNTQQKILRLSRDVAVASAIYTQLLNKTQELKIAKAGTIGNVRIIDSAVVSDQAIKPKKTLIVIIATLLGFIFAVFLVLIKKAIHQEIRDSSLVEKRIGLPVYATVPLSSRQDLLEKTLKSKNEHLILAEHNSSDLAIESLRSLRTNLSFALLEAKNNLVMITGPSPSVGKSFISTNLAHVIAKSGKRVLLIDADMRKGHIHKSYRLPRGPGLSELISGSASKEQAVQKTSFDNIDLIATGTIPPNPSELLMNANFEHLCQEFSADYDLVLIDTPPLLAVTDAAIVGKLCGTSFILLRFARHPMAEIELAVKRMQQNNIDLKGFIFNGVELENKKNYGKYGYYSYEYK